MNEQEKRVHLAHCYQGEYEGSCKSGLEGNECPACDEDDHLAHCPFCKSKVEIHYNGELGYLLCTDRDSTCLESGLVTLFRKEKETEAIRAWNMSKLNV